RGPNRRWPRRALREEWNEPHEDAWAHWAESRTRSKRPPRSHGEERMLTLTDAARTKLSEVLSGQPEPVYGLRVSIQASGCCGHQYALSLARGAETGDWVGEFQGIKVLVDPDSAPLLQGIQIDYVESLQA